MTCTSIGDGRPKLRICVTISAGRKAKVVPGNCRGSVSRSARDEFVDLALPAGLQRDQDIGVARADRAGIAVGRD